MNKLHKKVLEVVNSTAEKELLNNNANKASERIPVMRDMVAGEVAKEIALETLLPKHIAQAHISGDIHYHDLDYSPVFPQNNCMLVDLKNLLEGGFMMGNAEIETPKSITTATAIVAQIIAQVASHIYGGTTINRIDEVLAPYVRASYDKWLATGLVWFKGCDREAAVFATQMVEKDTFDAFQSLEYEINTLHTANGQTPFVTLGFGLGRSWEERLIQKSILENRMAGLGKSKKTAIFPKLVFTIKEGLNRKKSDPNYDIKKLALKCASERMYPDILNYDKLVEVTGGFKAPMGCRSFLHEVGDGTHDGRNNMGVVSVNIPRIAIRSANKADFFKKLDESLEVAYEALLTRVDRLRLVQAKVAPILYTEGACGVRLDPEDYVFDRVYGNGRASISLGYIGLHEAANALFGIDKHTFDSPEKKEFIEEVVTHLKGATVEWKEETGLAFSLYSTPSESLCDRFCRLDIEEFGDVPGVTDKGYYTNSFHLDVFKKVTPFEKIDFEAEFPYYATGGFISYVEFPNMLHNLEGLEAVWDYTYDKLPYFGTNTPIDECLACGHKGEALATEDGFECASCGNSEQNTLSVTRRVCGYLGSPNARPFIEGKQKEVIARVKHQ